MKVYIVFWVDAFDDWKVVKVFSSEDKARAYVKGKSDSYWYMEEVVE